MSLYSLNFDSKDFCLNVPVILDTFQIFISDGGRPIKSHDKIFNVILGWWVNKWKALILKDGAANSDT